MEIKTTLPRPKMHHPEVVLSNHGNGLMVFLFN